MHKTSNKIPRPSPQRPWPFPNRTERLDSVKPGGPHKIDRPIISDIKPGGPFKIDRPIISDVKPGGPHKIDRPIISDIRPGGPLVLDGVHLSDQAQFLTQAEADEAFRMQQQAQMALESGASGPAASHPDGTHVQCRNKDLFLPSTPEPKLMPSPYKWR